MNTMILERNHLERQLQSRFEMFRNEFDSVFSSQLLHFYVKNEEEKCQVYTKIFMQKGANINARAIDSCAEEKRTIFMDLCEEGSLESVLAFLAYPHLDVRAVDINGENCMFYLLRRKNEKQIEDLIEKVAQIHPSLLMSTRANGDSILVLAFKKRLFTIFNRLATNNLVDINHQNHLTGNTILHECLKQANELSSGELETCFAILGEAGIDPNLKNYYNQSAFWKYQLLSALKLKWMSLMDFILDADLEEKTQIISLKEENNKKKSVKQQIKSEIKQYTKSMRKQQRKLDDLKKSEENNNFLEEKLIIQENEENEQKDAQVKQCSSKTEQVNKQEEKIIEQKDLYSQILEKSEQTLSQQIKNQTIKQEDFQKKQFVNKLQQNIEIEKQKKIQHTIKKEQQKASQEEEAQTTPKSSNEQQKQEYVEKQIEQQKIHEKEIKQIQKEQMLKQKQLQSLQVQVEVKIQKKDEDEEKKLQNQLEVKDKLEKQIPQESKESYEEIVNESKVEIQVVQMEELETNLELKPERQQSVQEVVSQKEKQLEEQKDEKRELQQQKYISKESPTQVLNNQIQGHLIKEQNLKKQKYSGLNDKNEASQRKVLQEYSGEKEQRLKQEKKIEQEIKLQEKNENRKDKEQKVEEQIPIQIKSQKNRLKEKEKASEQIERSMRQKHLANKFIEIQQPVVKKTIEEKEINKPREVKYKLKEEMVNEINEEFKMKKGYQQREEEKNKIQISEESESNNEQGIKTIYRKTSWLAQSWIKTKNQYEAMRLNLKKNLLRNQIFLKGNCSENSEQEQEINKAENYLKQKKNMLERQMKNYSDKQILEQKKIKQKIRQVYKILQQNGKKFRFDITLYGSLEGGYWGEGSDVNIAFIRQKMEKKKILILSDVVQQLKFRKQNKHLFREIHVDDSGREPVIRFHFDKLNFKVILSEGINFHIRSTRSLTEYFLKNKLIIDTYFVIRKYFESLGLMGYKNMSSYALISILSSFFAKNPHQKNRADILLNFCIYLISLRSDKVLESSEGKRRISQTLDFYDEMDSSLFEGQDMSLLFSKVQLLPNLLENSPSQNILSYLFDSSIICQETEITNPSSVFIKSSIAKRMKEMNILDDETNQGKVKRAVREKTIQQNTQLQKIQEKKEQRVVNLDDSSESSQGFY